MKFEIEIFIYCTFISYNVSALENTKKRNIFLNSRDTYFQVQVVKVWQKIETHSFHLNSTKSLLHVDQKHSRERSMHFVFIFTKLDFLLFNVINFQCRSSLNTKYLYNTEFTVNFPVKQLYSLFIFIGNLYLYLEVFIDSFFSYPLFFLIISEAEVSFLVISCVISHFA